MAIKEQYRDRMFRIHKELDSVSRTYCVAKWQQVTIHLATGQTHSCHHPTTHKIPLEEVSVNPSALHNTKFKKEQRKLMLEGQRPEECDYCWRAEDAPGDHFSDRIKKSSDAHWAEPYIKSSAEMPWDADVIPSYVEVSFSNVCNFGCAYCSPEISSTLMQTVKRHGPIVLSQRVEQDLSWLVNSDRMPIPNREANPYIDAWWAWWPTLYPRLRTFRITGGEPLLSKETFKTLDWIIANPNPELDLAINTNLSVDQDVLDEFFAKCQIIKDGGMVKRLQIFTSCDTWGKQAEYIRTGLDYSKWYYNLWNLTLRYPRLDVTIMCTFNILSIPKFRNFLNDILAIRRSATTMNKVNGIRGVNLDFPYLRHPRHLSALIADQALTIMLDETVRWAERNVATFTDVDYHDGFYPHEIDNLRRLLHIVQAENPQSKDNVVSRHDFYLFVNQHDTRNNTNFLSVFPEFTDFYNRCKNEYEASVAAKNLALNNNGE
jgi:sulfatase maturation enzyme AslB (radical SAM superfamily)